MRWRRSQERPIVAPRAQPGSPRTSPLPHPAPWRSRSAARPRHRGAGPRGGAYANMFTLKFGLAFPEGGEPVLACAWLSGWGGGCGFGRRVSGFRAPLLGTFTPLAAADSCSESLTPRFLGPRIAWASACGSHTLQNFLSLTLHEGIRSLGNRGVESANAGPRIDKTI